MKGLPPIGAMRQRITIQEPTRTRDAYGGRVQPWDAVTGGEVWASVSPIGEFERQAYAHDLGGITHIVWIRHPGFEVTKRNRILYGTRVLEVRGVSQPDERGRWVRIRAEETVTGGGGDDGE